MKKNLLLASALLFIVFAGYSNAKYTIDDSKVEQLIESSVQVQLVNDLYNVDFGTTKIMDEKNVWVAVALDFFLGGLAVHRVYLGANPGLIAGYFFTCGGIFGILPLVDLILLVINSDDISPYVDNKNFFMWKDK